MASSSCKPEDVAASSPPAVAEDDNSSEELDELTVVDLTHLKKPRKKVFSFFTRPCSEVAFSFAVSELTDASVQSTEPVSTSGDQEPDYHYQEV
jgi:hypothetical protein